jgi:hypothetical protein
MPSHDGPRRPTPARPPLRPDRLRRIEPGGFAFVPNRFLRDGFFASLTTDERSLYLFLVLAADRDGISFYRYDSICSILQLPLESYLQARDRLIDQDLLAFDGTRFQVLSLPQKPIPPTSHLVTQQDRERDDPATIRALLLREIETDPKP